MAILRMLLTNLGLDIEPVLGRYSFLLLDQTPDLVWMSVIFCIIMLFTTYIFGKRSQAVIQEQFKKTSNITDYSNYLDEVENSEDLSLAQQNMISRLKIARQKAMNKSIEEKLSPEERLQEKRIENEQMEKILSLLKENEGMSMDDLKDQMSMYKTD
ncbi:hypothetical protein TCAL_09667 [Tigriopus californicus]|uniref:Matrix-remodeling-associated protein 7 helical domain-containing protein n=1 Tax=Tigriopus californicus TaxID=6832 RepID=A0A553NSF1_TIGCA|nr:uncharacterized protein LOC131883201 [Tigriopus californicus]TRY68371.1 hypothetical protein TCAL_09667 [Tigriopus californicus]